MPLFPVSLVAATSPLMIARKRGATAMMSKTALMMPTSRFSAHTGTMRAMPRFQAALSVGSGRPADTSSVALISPAWAAAATKLSTTPTRNTTQPSPARAPPRRFPRVFFSSGELTEKLTFGLG